MDNSVTASIAAVEAAAMDFPSLRQQGIELIQRLAGGTWTDHNIHDPGITILEQVCYALTDLAYRSQYDLPDLLARDGKDPYASLYSPAQVLPTSPVTMADLRKLVIDVPGVKNAWIDIVDEPLASFDAVKGEVSYGATQDGRQGTAAPSPNVSEIRVKGLYRVRIEKSDLVDADGGAIRAEVARRLHRHRGLGEDFQEIKVLDPQLVPLSATLEIDTSRDVVALLANVYQTIAAYMSPSIPFHTLGEMLARGRRVDEIFEGPLLDHGFIDPDEFARIERLTSLRVSDLIRELMAVPGVIAVKNLRFMTPDLKLSRDWLFQIDPDRTPRLDLQHSDIRLEKGSLRVDEGIQDAAKKLFVELAARAANPALIPEAERDLRPPDGRNRNVGNYASMQQQFPEVYGIGPAGLSQAASPERRAQAKQLKAYLMFYDQLLADHFAQLANAGSLFSIQDEALDSYFSGVIGDDGGTLGLDSIRVSNADQHRELLRGFTEDPVHGLRRRNRFLDHLLARFSEQFHEYGLLQSGIDAQGGVSVEERLARDKRAFLRDYPRMGRDRGTGLDYLQPDAIKRTSGLELTLRRKLGIRAEEERFRLVEHILLRPIAGDRNQSGPLLRGARGRDPYSLQVTLVFPSWPSRYQDPNFRQFVEQTVQEETPAHLTAYVLWKDQPAMQAFEAAYALWLQQWRDHRRAELGL